MSRLSELLAVDSETLELSQQLEFVCALHAEVKVFLSQLMPLLRDPSLDGAQCKEKVIALVREYGLIPPVTISRKSILPSRGRSGKLRQ